MRNVVRRGALGTTTGAALLALCLAGAVPAQAAAGFDPTAASARTGGADRYETSALIAEQNWTTADTVIVANGDNGGIDALSASYLAGILDAPILLTAQGAVPQPTLQAIAKLNPRKVIVAGSPASVSASTLAALSTGRQAERIGGADRYETAELLVEQGIEESGQNPTTIFVARGDVEPGRVAADALAASPIAYRAHVAVLLSPLFQLPDVTARVISQVNPPSISVLGDTTGISEDVRGQIDALTSRGGTQRIGGIDRTATAADLAEWALANVPGFHASGVGIANGWTVDALSAGPAVARSGFPLLLTASVDDLGPSTTAYLQAHANALTTAEVFGDGNSVSLVAAEAARVAGGGQ